MRTHSMAFKKEDIEIRMTWIRGGRSCRTADRSYYLYSNGKELYYKGAGRQSFSTKKSAKEFLEKLFNNELQTERYEWI